MADLSGHTLGKYQLTDRLGRGGMADVYKGYHPRLERYVAVKTLHSYLVEGETDFLPRFEREAKAVAALQHPNIVQVYDFDVQDDIYYMVMQLVDGGSLAAWLGQFAHAEKYMPYDQVVQIMDEVASALDFAHQKGMIHRDIKPSNVLLDKDGHAYLADFGIARIMSGGTQYTSTGTLIGTPHYMSPEQGSGQTVTPASDVYSLGVVLFEMLVGRVPFDAETPYAIIHQHIQVPIPRPRDQRPDLPEAVEAVLFKAMEKEPGNRYQSAGEMVQALRQALQGGSQPYIPASPGQVPATSGVFVQTPAQAPQMPSYETVAVGEAAMSGAASASASTSVPSIEAPAMQPAADGEQPEVRPRRTSRVLLIIGGLIVLCIAAAAVLWFTRPPACPDPGACLDAAEQLAANNQPVRAVNMLDRALSLVPPDQHPAHAFIACRRGELLQRINQKAAAISSFHMCIDWTEGDLDLESVRVSAQQHIQELSK